MSRHKVSRGNTSDLIGMFNKKSQIEAPSSGDVGGLLSVNPGSLGVSHKFRKTSAFVPSTTKIEDKVKDDVKFRKTSAMVLMPTVTLTPTDFATDLKNSLNHRSLNVDTQLPEYKPMKTVSGLENGSAELPKLRSALKLSTVTPPKIETESSLDTNNNNNRRGSVGLGRSKSVCHKVKFEPPQLQVALPGMTSSKNEGHGRPKISTSFAKFQQMDNSSQSQLSPEPSRLSRQNSLPSLNERKVSAPPPSTSHSGSTLGGGGTGNGGGLRRSTVVARSPSSAKEVILSWVQERTNTYPNLKVTNFSSSWNDGMAFCALVHYYFPEAFEWSELDPKNRRYNFDLAFRSAEHFADICPLLDVEDMVMFEKPDWKCVFTYVQTFFRRFRNGRDPPVPTKKLTLTPSLNLAPTINLAKSIEVSTLPTSLKTNQNSSETKAKKVVKIEEPDQTATESSQKEPKKAEPDPDLPYYFPAPEISEEKKMSLMQKYLDIDAEEKKLAKKRSVNIGAGKSQTGNRSGETGSGT